VAQRGTEGAAGFDRVAAVGDGLFDVGFEFFVELTVKAEWEERVGDAGPQRHLR
jgi:hypothetical protein